MFSRFFYQMIFNIAALAAIFFGMIYFMPNEKLLQIIEVLDRLKDFKIIMGG